MNENTRVHSDELEKQKMIHNFESFTNALQDILQQYINNMTEESFKIETHEVMKTNEIKHGMTVRFEDSKIAPTLYVEDAYEKFQDGETIESIAEKMALTAYRARDQTMEIPELTLEEAKKSMTLVMMNTERNQQLLENVPHYELGDLSAVPRWQISEEASFIVTNDIAARLSLTPDEVIAIGQANIKEQEFVIKPMTEILREMMIKDGMDSEMLDMMMPELGEEIPQMLVITNESGIQGSNAMLSQKTLETIQERFNGEPFKILPSSRHEVIAVPESAGIQPQALRAMVHEVNMTQVAPQDFLSDSIYKFDGQKISMVMEDLKIEAPKMDEPKMHYSTMKM